MGKFILNADDFGLSEFHNIAVFEGWKNGFLKSASLCTNTKAFKNAVENIIPKCPYLDVGVHLNIIEDKSLTFCPLLTDNNGYFNKNYIYFLLNQNNKQFLEQVENEFRAQIELAKKYIVINHIDSHVHTHAIPPIFNITCKLAKEYNISFVRTQYEKPYLVSNKCINPKYFINLLKIMLLGYFTKINKKTIKKYMLKTNDYVIGVGYTGMMNKNTILSGIKK